MRIVFAGTAGFAIPSLEQLAVAGHDIVLVVTQPDRLAGRGLKPLPSPVKKRALEIGLNLDQPDRIRDEAAQARILDLDPDALVVVAYGQILPATLISRPRLGTMNVHASLLPRHRGPAPIEWAILSGDSETGVTIMQMDAGVDTGPILRQETVSIGATETATQLEQRLAEVGGRLLVRTIEEFQRGTVTPRPQAAEGASHARRLRSEDGKLSPDMSAAEIDRRVRALADRVGVWLAHPAGNVKIVRGRLATGEVANGMPIVTPDGVYVVDEVQPPGGRVMSAAAWVRGRR
ncbi:MAG: methionyl-tRNA formyltransferase [Chloroflexi bacterium]|nr:MAG: methionyl-tRNA formyltransferase [Chloroflexota bacterium]TME46156.1 MAG: methionyl-tRNA formyltransferase [Chloroflexota bacterium]